MQMTFLERAIAVGRQGMENERGGPFGAVVARGDECLGEACNEVTSRLDPTAHAEILAIQAACQRLGTYQLSGCHLYSSCEPCPMCLAAAYWARVDAIYFAASREDAQAIGFDDAFIYGEFARPLTARRLPIRQALRSQAQSMMQPWLGVAATRRY